MGGQSLPFISKQLGHEKVSTTTSYYIKYIKEEEEAKKIEKIFNFGTF